MFWAIVRCEITPAFMPSVRNRHVGGLLVFALAFIGLEVFSYTRESATWDEPIHLMDGYLSLAHGDFRADIEHPPLLRMWAALPIVPLRVVDTATGVIERTLPTDWALGRLFSTTHRFVYVDNDADALLYRARFMIVLLGIVLGVLLYAWAFALFGRATALVLLALYTVEPNIASHARLVTTDFGVTLAIFGATYFTWRLSARWSLASLAGVAACVALAVTSKYSGLLAGPILGLLLAFAVWRRTMTPARAAIVLLVLGISSVTALWATYGFYYLPSRSPTWRYAIHNEPAATGPVPTLARAVAWIDERHLLPNAYSEGLLLSRVRSQGRKTFLAGEYSITGWWYYFPVAFALKTPLTLIVLAAAGTWFARRQASTLVFLFVPVAIVLGSAMSAHINIGLRHILPIYPFVILLAGWAVQRLLSSPRRFVPAAALAIAVAEPLTVYPHTLAFFNVLAGGPSGGSRYLTDSNIDWGQDLKGLKSWMVRSGVDHVNLSYFGLADPHYYGIDCTFLPGSESWVRSDLVRLPKLPGYVAVSVTMLRGVYADTPRQREFYTRLAALQPVASIGHSILVFKVEQPWYTDLVR